MPRCVDIAPHYRDRLSFARTRPRAVVRHAAVRRPLCSRTVPHHSARKSQDTTYAGCSAAGLTPEIRLSAKRLLLLVEFIAEQPQALELNHATRINQPDATFEADSNNHGACEQLLDRPWGEILATRAKKCC
jgi:hypothetical protein